MAFSVGAGAGGRRPVGASLAEINIIPLVDVVLVLLLIFMLTAPMMYRGIDVTLPRTASKPTAVEERLVLTVTRERRLYLNDREGGLPTLEAAPRRQLGGRADTTPYLKADARPRYGGVI